MVVKVITEEPKESSSEKSEKKAEVLPPAPRVMSAEISPLAKDFIKKLDKLVADKNWEELAELAYDAVCEDLDTQIDVEWYEKMAAMNQ